MSRPRICTPGIATLLLITTFGQLAIVARALTLPNQPPVGILVAIGLALAAGLQLRAEIGWREMRLDGRLRTCISQH